MEFVPAVAMFTLILKVVDFFRYLRAGDANGVLTQLVVWAGGVGVMLLSAQTVWAEGIQVADRPLSTLDIWSQVFAGIAVGSTASAFKDLTKAVDQSNSAKIPTLLATAGAHRASNRGAGKGDVG